MTLKMTEGLDVENRRSPRTVRTGEALCIPGIEQGMHDAPLRGLRSDRWHSYFCYSATIKQVESELLLSYLAVELSIKAAKTEFLLRI